MVMDRVVNGMDPHKRSVTIEARDTREVLRAVGSFGTDSPSSGARSSWNRDPRRARERRPSRQLLSTRIRLLPPHIDQLTHEWAVTSDAVARGAGQRLKSTVRHNRRLGRPWLTTCVLWKRHGPVVVREGGGAAARRHRRSPFR